MLFADGMLCLLAHWEWGHVLGIFFAWVAPSGPGTTALCPCPGVLHPNYVLAISRDVGKASGRSVTFSLGLLTGCGVCERLCVYMSVSTCVLTCVHGCGCVVMASYKFFVTLYLLYFTICIHPCCFV